MKVTTDGCLFGAWIANEVRSNRSEVRPVLDIGTGTGLLSLLYAQKNSNSGIDAIEIDKDSFEQAKENIAASPWKDRINIFHGDARAFEFSHQYDVIISNPPFYENELRSEDEKRNIALHSYELSLDELLQVIQSNLSPSGIFFLLLPYKRQGEIRKLFQKYQFALSQLIFVRQSVKHDYFRLIVNGRRVDGKLTETLFDEISIWNDKQEYTNGFKELLKDYYLYL